MTAPDPLSAYRTTLPELRAALAEHDDNGGSTPGNTRLADAARDLIAALDAAGINPASVPEVDPEELRAAGFYVSDEAAAVKTGTRFNTGVVTDAAGVPDTRPWVIGPSPLAAAQDGPSKVLRCLVCNTPNEVPSSVDTVTCWACGKTSQPLAGTVTPRPDMDDVPRET